MGLFGPPDVGRLARKRDVPGLIKALGFKRDRGVRRAAAQALGELGYPGATPALIAALSDPDRFVGASAAQALGRLGGAGVVDPLIGALEEGESFVSEAAAKSLGKIGDGRAVGPLVSALSSQNKDLRYSAAEALGMIGDGRAVQPLAAALGDPDGMVRLAAAEALGLLRDARAAAPLAAALKDANVRLAAASALVAVGRPGVPALTAVLQDPDESARTAAARVLQKLGGPDDDTGRAWQAVVLQDWATAIRLGAAAVDPLAAALSHEDAGVRGAAVEALGKIGDARAAGPLLAALDDSDEIVRRRAAEVLGLLGDTRAAGPLARAVSDRDAAVRLAAARALATFGDGGDTVALAERAVALRDWPAAIGLGAAAVPPLEVALQDRDPEVRQAAADALGQICDARACTPLVAALGDGDEFVRFLAAEALGQISLAQAFAPLAGVLGDKSEDVRGAAARALWRIGDRPRIDRLALELVKAENWVAASQLGTAAVTPLAERLRDDSGSVRRGAAQALQWIYERGDYTAADRQVILSHRQRMAAPHEDRLVQRWESYRHQDVGIGVFIVAADD